MNESPTGEHEKVAASTEVYCRSSQGGGPQTCLEGKPRTPLSSPVATRVSWSPLRGLKGVQPPVKFGERTWDCSPGHAYFLITLYLLYENILTRK